MGDEETCEWAVGMIAPQRDEPPASLRAQPANDRLREVEKLSKPCTAQDVLHDTPLAQLHGMLLEQTRIRRGANSAATTRTSDRTAALVMLITLASGKPMRLTYDDVRMTDAPSARCGIPARRRGECAIQIGVHDLVVQLVRSIDDRR